VIRLDDAIYNAANAESPAENPVNRQLGQLARAFGGGRE
jgi:regulator of CtrA degradation